MHSRLPAFLSGTALSPQSVAIAGVLFYAGGLFFSTFLVSLGKVILLGHFFWQLKARGKKWVAEPLTVLSTLILLYLFSLSWFTANSASSDLARQLAGAVELAGIPFFALCLALALAAKPSFPAYLPAILSFSFLAGIFLHFPGVSWTGWPLNRPGFGMPVNAFALYSAVVLCGLLLFGRNVLPGRRQRHPLWRGVLFATALLAAFGGVVLPQSRSAWLACLLVFPWLWLWQKRQGIFRSPGKPAWAFLLLVLVLAGVYGQSMIERTNQDRAMFRTVLQDGLQDFRPAKMTSAGTRVVLWQEGVRRWLEKPLTGWGPRRTAYLTEPLWSSFHIDKARDFHNSYLELLVRTGVFGIVLFAVLVYIALRSLHAGLRARWFSLDLALFVLGSLLLFAVCSFFNDRLDHMGRNFVSLFIGTACSYRYRWVFAEPEKNPAKIGHAP